MTGWEALCFSQSIYICHIWKKLNFYIDLVLMGSDSNLTLMMNFIVVDNWAWKSWSKVIFHLYLGGNKLCLYHSAWGCLLVTLQWIFGLVPNSRIRVLGYSWNFVVPLFKYLLLIVMLYDSTGTWSFHLEPTYLFIYRHLQWTPFPFILLALFNLSGHINFGHEDIFFLQFVGLQFALLVW